MLKGDYSMVKEIIIGDENVRVVESHIDNGVSTPMMTVRSDTIGDYTSKLVKRLNYGTNQILPQNCRFVRPADSNTVMLIIEDRPKIRTVKFLYDFKREFELARYTGQDDLDIGRFIAGKTSPYLLKLSFPYITYIALIRENQSEYIAVDFRVFFRCHPIAKMNDYLYIANILNLSEGNSLCFGRVGGYSRSKFSSLSDLTNHLIDSFWAKPFSDEYQSRHYLYHAHSRLHGFLPWAHYTEKDPLFIYSTDWIVHTNNLEQEMDDIISSIHISTTLMTKQIFIDNSLPIINPNDPDRRYIYDNVNLNDKAILSLGDQVIYDNNPVYIYSFLGNRDGVTRISFINDNGDISDYVPITPELIADWGNQVEQSLNNYVDSIEVDGHMIKRGSIIKIKPTESYEIVQAIRLSRDKRYELLLGKRFYIVREGVFEFIDFFSLDNIRLLPFLDYIICNNQYQTVFRGKLGKVENNNYNILYFFFEDLDTHTNRGISIDSIQIGDVSIFKFDDPKVIKPNVFVYLNKLYYNNDNGFVPYTIIKGHGVYSAYDYGNNTEFSHVYDRGQVLNNIQNGNRLYITGVDKDIEFMKGDQVIVADWSNNEIIKIKTITDFVIDNDVDDYPTKLSFELTDSDGNKSMVEYINLLNGNIKVGHIRKVKSEYDGIKVGSIIRSNVQGFYNFPRRVSHKISAFIVDSEKPIILCESGLTLWLDDVKQHFDIIDPDTPRFRRIRRTVPFDIEKIGWRSGDVVTKDNQLFILNKDNEHSDIIYMNVDPNYIKSGSLKNKVTISRNLDPSFKRYGIQDPRFKEKESEVRYEMIPNFHNGYFKGPFDGYYFQTVRKD